MSKFDRGVSSSKTRAFQDHLDAPAIHLVHDLRKRAGFDIQGGYGGRQAGGDGTRGLVDVGDIDPGTTGRESGLSGDQTNRTDARHQRHFSRLDPRRCGGVNAYGQGFDHSGLGKRRVVGRFEGKRLWVDNHWPQDAKPRLCRPKARGRVNVAQARQRREAVGVGDARQLAEAGHGESSGEIRTTDLGIGLLEPLALIGPFPSGAPAIVIGQCARKGGSAGIIATLGRDDFGRVKLNRLRRDGADVSAEAILPDPLTGSAFVRYRPDGSRDFVFKIARSAAGLVSLPARARPLLVRPDLCLSWKAPSPSRILGRCRQRPSRSRGQGGSVLRDRKLRKDLLSQGQMRHRLAPVVGQSNLLLPSGDELCLAAGG